MNRTEEYRGRAVFYPVNYRVGSAAYVDLGRGIDMRPVCEKNIGSIMYIGGLTVGNGAMAEDVVKELHDFISRFGLRAWRLRQPPSPTLRASAVTSYPGPACL
jgi:hypothetical protein